MIILPQGSTSADLQKAINNVVSEETIMISDNMEFADVVTIPTGKELLIGSQGENSIMSQKTPDIRHFNVDGRLTLQNVTLAGELAGGVQVNENATVVLKGSVVIFECSNSGNGGGISINNGTLTMESGVLLGNVSGGNGGGIYSMGANSLVELLGGKIEKNHCLGGGGGIYAINMKMSGGEITNNYTDGGSGGGAYTTHSFEMSGGEISYNEVRLQPEQRTASGGGIYCSGVLGAPVTITGGKIHHNKVGITPGGSRGGGICVFRGVKFLMSGGEIYENEAVWGGGMFFDAYMQYGIPEENTVITGTTFIHDNKATQGGGICFYNNVPGAPDIGILGMAPQINGNVKITGNSSSYGGGIKFYAYLGTSQPVQVMMNPTISGNVEISGNEAAVRGAGVEICDDDKGLRVIAALTVTDNVTINENTITEETELGGGGGIYGMNADIAIKNKVQVLDNASNASGGGIYAMNSTLNLTDITVSGNTAKTGGGIFTENYDDIVIDENTVFYCNKAQMAYQPPENATDLYPNIKFTSTSITSHPLNNFDINYTDSIPIDVKYNTLYDANGGVGSYVGPDVEEGGADVVLSADETGISRGEYIFTSWNTKPDGSGIGYVAGDTVIVNCTVRLYAQWAVVESYTVTYDCNGGRGGYIDPGRLYPLLYTVLNTNQTGISRTGFLFTTWNTERNGSGISYAPGDTILISRNLNLYAQWGLFPLQKKLCDVPPTKSRKAIEGQILWVDNNNAGDTRPSSAEILLLRDGEVYRRANVDSTGDGYFGFCCLPANKSLTRKYNYRIDETPIQGYTKTVEGYTVINTLGL